MRSHFFFMLWSVSVAATAAFMMPGRRSLPVRLGVPLSTKTGLTMAVEYQYNNKNYLPQSDTMKEYVKDLRTVDMLTAQEEILLTRQIKRGMEIEKALVTLEKTLGRKPTEEEWVNFVGLKSIDDIRKNLKRASKSKSAIINANLRLVVSTAKAYQYRGVSFQDLVQEGTCGLHKATEKFDPRKGFRFSTYATWWIKQGIMRAVTDQSRVVRLPVHVHDALFHIRRAKANFWTEHLREPTLAELAEATGLTPQKIVFYDTVKDKVSSIDKTVGIGTKTNSMEKSQIAISDMCKDSRNKPEETAQVESLRQDISRLINTLSPREQDVVRMRYGLDDGEIRTLEEIGSIFSVTRERVRQIEARALHKLRQPYRNHRLKGQLDSVDALFHEKAHI
uniref:RNA polymerase sigma-70 domain-containing protein n=2 Tax=Heterosigma akashiwo TaxID=2829 RepID=A0A6V1X7N2_HETAK|mmetsp:Transcript_30975/g.57083  ORF Transcript_30975/g.57083 Transcript_30975/m.57083 type:complete len:392 (+) Transcript_30975:232-1407(+)|eukprot:CAMPEP_0206402616 /NCGR_PEP_ID=MMETSP0294-20121207/27114_1 /ASSEMBLY_ACC=CAM_ASM_000327 /TAXON_ID=39354 /ORGANISM="Heterosigma akashiwo, Strain CCMP2393" /LENGTH=391 /DNA_ID=CAMNT_0053859827 /DNA_START=279 /DNA_END=1454 /DNA_ORIENTATION=-